MKSPHLPPLSEALEHYDIPFKITGFFSSIRLPRFQSKEEVNELIDAVDASGRNFIAVYPNCDRAPRLSWMRMQPVLRTIRE